MSSRFPVGFWNYPNVSRLNPDEVERWVRCGMTLTQSPVFSYEENTKEDLLPFLDEAERLGIKLIIMISDLTYRGLIKLGEDEYRKILKKAYEDFGNHPATYGFYAGDEPIGNEASEAIIKAMQIQREIAPHLTPFANLHPYYRLCERRLYSGKTFNEWGDDFMERSGCKILCYDCYSQMGPDPDGVDNYFYNLNLFMELAKKHGAEPWITLLSTTHFNYVVKTEEDFLWQINSAVASGYRGIMWFFFYMDRSRNCYTRCAVNEFGEETETFTNLSYITRRLHNMCSDLFYRLRHKKTYHVVRAFGGYEIFPGDTHKFVRMVDSVHRLPAIISFFEDEEGKEYVVLMNNSKTEAGSFALVLNENVKKIFYVEENGKLEREFTIENNPLLHTFHKNKEGTFVGDWLTPGQMMIFRFE